MKHLLDTDICIYLIKQKPPEVLKHFSRLSTGDIGISSVSTSELYYGASKSQRVQENTEALNDFLLPLDIMPYNEIASTFYGTLRVDLERRGQIIGMMDMMIAAHALSLDIALVTNNVREFSRVQGLQVENWVGA